MDGLVAAVKAGPSPSTFKFLTAKLRGSEVGYRAPYDPLTPAEESAVLAKLEPVRSRLAPFLAK